jgi:hypothetical protein
MLIPSSDRARVVLPSLLVGTAERGLAIDIYYFKRASFFCSLLASAAQNALLNEGQRDHGAASALSLSEKRRFLLFSARYFLMQI